VVNVRRVGRLGMLAVGLGVGAALVPSPGMAFADSSSDWLASIDGLLAGSGLPAASSGLNLSVSFDGYSLIQEGSATAHTATGEYGLAIAEGSGAYAYAGGGIGDVAEAEGTNALAIAGGEPYDTGANYDTAIDIGTNDLPSTGAADGAYAGTATWAEAPGPVPMTLPSTSATTPTAPAAGATRARSPALVAWAESLGTVTRHRH
jgi:hypothetical protein